MGNREKKICVAALAIMLSGLSGCARQVNLAQESVKFNNALELSSNRILLLNALRSRQGMPIYYSTLGSENLQLTAQPKITLGIPFGNNTPTTNNLGLEFAGQRQATVELQSQNDQKYLAAMRTPIDEETFRSYWESGWKKDVLLYTFVSAIRVPPDDPMLEAFKKECPETKPITHPDYAEIVSVPYAGEQNCLFDKFVGELRHTYFEQKDTEQVVVWPDPKLKDLTPDGIATLEEKGFRLGKDKKGARAIVKDGTPTYTFKLKAPEPYKDKGGMTKRNCAETADAKIERGTIGILLFSAKDQKPSKCGPSKTPQFTFVLRSPEAMINFLGRALRASDKDRLMIEDGCEDGVDKPICGRDEKVLRPYFKVQSDFAHIHSLDGEASLWVDFEGKRYWIPKKFEDFGYTYHAMTLVNHVLGLHQDKSEAPVVNTINVKTF